MADFIVTPWEVSGDVDYSALIKQFGTQPLNEVTRKRIVKHCGDHMFLRRGLFFSHRDMDLWMNDYEKGKKVYLYTGRAPSGPVHIGHLVPWIFTKHLQDGFKAPLLFQIPDEEKVMFKENLTFEDTHKWAMDNILDIIACGFDPKKTDIFLDTEYAKTMYKTAMETAKRITFSTAKAVFGFDNSNNLGEIFYTAMQSVPAFLPTQREGKETKVLIPHAIDQDPHFRVTRDVAQKLGYPKPCAIHTKFLPGLGRGASKMGSSEQETCIYATDTPEAVKKKIGGTFTGGRDTVEEQKKKGGEPDICTVFKYFYYIFEQDDKKLEERKRKCKSGELLCGECKQDLVKYINEFLNKHQANREKAKGKIDQFLVCD
ncbi:MAG: tryptophan--tRNA ligase [archaeon]